MAARQNQILGVGAVAPDFRLPLLDGGHATLAELTAAGPILLVFFKVTCPVCQFTLPFLNRLQQPGTLSVYGISQNDPDDTREFNQEFGIAFPTLLDSEDSGYPASNAYGISSVPSIFLVEPGGRIARATEGWRKQEMQALGALRQGDNVPEWKAG